MIKIEASPIFQGCQVFCALLRPSLLVFSPADAAADAVEFEARGSVLGCIQWMPRMGIPQKERGSTRCQSLVSSES